MFRNELKSHHEEVRWTEMGSFSLFGGGSITGESQGLTVVVQKESQTYFVHRIRLGEGQTLSDKAPEPLPQGIVPPLDVRRQPGLLNSGRMLLGRDDELISLTEVAEAMAVAVGSGDCRRPQLLTG
jgi:hypothetical protein